MAALAKYLILTLFIVSTQGEDQIPELVASGCCSNKTVGGKEYKQVAGNIPEGLNCKSKCVYEKVEDPGSRFCFAEGNLTVECNEVDLDVKSVPVTYSEEGDVVSFDFSLGTLTCSNIGNQSDPESTENVTCTLNENALQGSGRQQGKQADLLIVENHWLALYMNDGRGIYCPWRGWRWGWCRPSPILKNRIFAEASFQDKHTQQECIDACNADKDCIFWTFSEAPRQGSGRVKRNHNGITECGNRKYDVRNTIEIFDRFGNLDKQQTCGLKNSPNPPLSAQTYVQDVFPSNLKVRSPYHCQWLCIRAPRGCRHWTFRLKPRRARGLCILSNYEPTRRVPIFGSQSHSLPANVISGYNRRCIRCQTLLDDLDEITTE